jgi:alanyl-tRNA synthetase
LLNDTLKDLKARGKDTIPGNVMFKLYDTYGFPVDIVRDVIYDQNVFIDEIGFNNAMAEQRAQSRSIAAFSTAGAAYKTLSSSGFSSRFLGYERDEVETAVSLLVKNGEEINTATTGDSIEVVTGETPFYGASGGQVGDTGAITSSSVALSVTDTIKDPTGLIIHKAIVQSGSIKKGDVVNLSIDQAIRRNTARNHTATHILHSVLREILGDHVKQAGSLVSPERLRFDFTHFSQIEPEILDQIEALINARVRENVPVNTMEMDVESAMKSGATALFEEKYGDRVRVVTLSNFSRELCGGTHTAATGDIGLFKIISETGVAAGVRRIEAFTGAAALSHIQKSEEILRSISRLTKEKSEALPARIEKVLGHQKVLEKEVVQLKALIASKSVEETGSDIQTVGDIRLVAKKVTVDTPAALRDLADKFKDKVNSGVVVLGSIAEGKVMLIVIVTKDLVGRFHAGKIIKEIAAVVGGSGGGRPDMAQAGGPNTDKLDEALQKVSEILAST